jgi:hypothetical protein
MTVFQDITLYRIISLFDIKEEPNPITVKMEACTTIQNEQTFDPTWRYNPEDRNLSSDCCASLMIVV